MPRLSLTAQFLVAPTVVIVLLCALLVYLVPQLEHLRQQNEAVRAWTMAIDHLQQASAAAQRLRSIVTDAAPGPASADLQFRYLEQAGALASNVTASELLDKATPDTREFLRQQATVLAYREGLDVVASRAALDALWPRLETLHGAFWAQKRAAYETYYANVKDRMPRLIGVSLGVLVLSIGAGLVLSAWSTLRINARLRVLASAAAGIAAGRLVSIPAPVRQRDALDVLAQNLADMTERLINVVSYEKIIQGAEDERRRIAMDLHDDTLAQLGLIVRELRAWRAGPAGAANAAALESLESQLAQACDGVRTIMDDLHPQALDLLGLEAALRAYLERHFNQPGQPALRLDVDSRAVDGLSPHQRLTLYRIILEAAHNVLRHAHCSRCEIGVRHLDGRLLLTVEDNGVGLPRAARDGRGMANIRQRAHLIGGVVRWSVARFSQGARLELTLELMQPGRPRVAAG